MPELIVVLDDDGLVLPPHVAPVKVALLPISTDEERLALMAGLKQKLGVLPTALIPTPITPVAATGTVIHGEPSGE